MTYVSKFSYETETKRIKSISLLDFIHNFRLYDPLAYAVGGCHLTSLDLLGIAAAGTANRLSLIIRDHSSKEFGSCPPMLFDNRSSNAQGMALAAL